MCVCVCSGHLRMTLGFDNYFRFILVDFMILLIPEPSLAPQQFSLLALLES